jgi:hypothetical protein
LDAIGDTTPLHLEWSIVGDVEIKAAALLIEFPQGADTNPVSGNSEDTAAR